ncbi:MAG: helix-turn-helix domain-containing protein [Pseudaminobacter sp.]
MKSLSKSAGYLSSAKTADRALTLLSLLAEDPRPMRVSEAAKKLGLPLSVVHRLFQSLVGAEYAAQDENRRYILGPAVSRLADRFFQSIDLRGRYRDLLAACRDLTDETSVLSIRKLDTRVIADYVISHRTIAAIPVLGESAPLLSGATGRAFVSTFGQADREDLYLRNGLSAEARAEIEALIQREKTRGYFVSSSPTITDLLGLAVPIPSTNGPSDAVVTIYCPEHRWKPDQIADISSALIHRVRTFVPTNNPVIRVSLPSQAKGTGL